MENSEGNALEEMEVVTQSISYYLNDLQQTAVGIGQNLFQTDTIKNVLSVATSFLEVIDDLTDSFGLLGTAGIAVAALQLGRLKKNWTEFIAIGEQKQLSSLFNGVSSATVDVNKLGTSLQNYSLSATKAELATTDLTESQIVAVLQAKGLNKETAELAAKEIVASQGATTMAASEGVATTSTNTLKTAMIGLGTAMTASPMAAFTAIITVIGLAVSAYSAFTSANEELIESARDAATTLEDETSEIEDSIEQYKELQKELQSAAGDEDAIAEIKEELLTLQESLHESYGDEYEKVNLVTGAYEEQLAVLQGIEKQKAQEYLNENQSAINSATTQMEKNRTYNLGSVYALSTDARVNGNGVANASEQAIIDEITKIANDLGITVDLNGAFKFTGTYEEQEETINEFMNQLRDLQNESGNVSTSISNVFDSLLTSSSKALGKATEGIEEYGDVYYTALENEIAINDNLSGTYSSLQDAVEAYNTAVSESDNAYNDESVVSAYENLKAIQDEIENAPEKWQAYQAVIDNTLSDVDTSSYDFYNSLSDDFENKWDVSQLKQLQLTETELASLVNSGGNRNVDSLVESATQAGIATDELISMLVDLGVTVENVSDEVEKLTEDSLMTFAEYWESEDFSEYADKLLELAKSGELTEETLETTDDYVTLLEETGLSAEEAKQEIMNLLDVTEKLSAASEGFSDIYDLYDEYSDYGMVLASTLSEMKDTVFGELDGWDLFASIVGDPTSTAEEVQEAFNDIATEYVIAETTLTGLLDASDSEIRQYIGNLTQMGVTNAQEVVDSVIALFKEMSDNCEEQGIELTDDLAQQALELANSEYNIADELETDLVNAYKQYLESKDDADLEYYENLVANDSDLLAALGADYQTDVANWIKALQAKTDAYNEWVTALNAAQSYTNFSSMNDSLGLKQTQTTYYDKNGDAIDTSSWTSAFAYDASGNLVKIVDETEQSLWNAADDAESAYEEMSADYAQYLEQLQLDLSGIDVDFTSLDYDGSTSSDASKDSSSNFSTSTKTFDWIERKINKLTTAYDKLNTVAESTYNTFSTRNKALSDEYDNITEQITTQQNAYTAYMNAANSVGLSSYYKNLVQSGNYSIQDITDEDLADKISKYQEYYDNAQSALQEVKDLQVQLGDISTEQFELIQTNYENKLSQLEHTATTLENSISLSESKADSTSSSYSSRLKALNSEYSDYNELLKNTKSQVSLLKEEETKLQASLAQGLSDGSIKKYSESWYELTDVLNEIDESIQECNQDIQDYTEELTQLGVEEFNLTQEKYENKLERLESSAAVIETNLSTAQSKLDSENNSYSTRTDALEDVEKYYKQLQKNNASQLSVLEQEKEALEQDLADAMSGDNGIKKYSDDWYTLQGAIDDVTEKIAECNETAEEYAEDLVELGNTQFELIQAFYSNTVDALDSASSLLEAYMDLEETRGHVLSADYYTALIDYEESSIEELESELKNLQDQLDSNVADGLEVGGDKWYEQYQAIVDVQTAIVEATNAIEEYNNEIRQLDWDAFDTIRDRIEDIVDESEFLINLMSYEDLYTDNGQLTDEGLATMAMHGTEMNIYSGLSEEISAEIEEIDKLLEDDPYDTELIERRQELVEAQREAIENYAEERQAIIDMVEDGIEKELDALQELIDKYEDALDSQKDLYDFQKNIESQTEELSSLYKQYEAYKNDDSESGKARLQELKVSIEEAESDLEETQYEQYISDQKELLESLYDSYEELLNQRLDNTDALIQDMVDMINGSASSVYTTLNDTTASVGTQLSDEMDALWGSTGTSTSAITSALTGSDSSVSSSVSSSATTVSNAVSNSTTSITNVLTLQGTGILSSLTTVNSVISSISTNVAKMYTEATKNSTTATTASNTVASTATSAAKTSSGSSSSSSSSSGSSSFTKTSTTSGSSSSSSSSKTSSSSNSSSNSSTSSSSSTKSSSSTSSTKTTTTTASSSSSSTQGDGKITTGDKVTYSSGKYYNDSYGGSPSGTKNRGKSVYITRYISSPKSGQNYPIHISTGKTLGSGDLGWLKKSQITGYSTGGVIGDLEKIAKSNGDDSLAINTLKKGEAVLTVEQTQQFKEFAESLPNLQNLVDTQGYTNGATITDNSTGDISCEVNVEIDHVDDYNDLVNQMKNDSKFEKMIQAITVDRIAGKSSLSKNKYSW